MEKETIQGIKWQSEIHRRGEGSGESKGVERNTTQGIMGRNGLRSAVREGYSTGENV